MEGINLSLLPPLEIVDELSHEEITVAIATKAGLENAAPSDPAYRVALAAAYRELLYRQHANEQVRGVMLAFATGAQLDHIGVTYYKHADGSPVVRLEDESDDDYRARLQASPEGLSVAGPVGAYQFHAQSADSTIKDVAVLSPAPVEVDVYLLGYEGSGAVDASVCDRVAAYLEPRRPLTDRLTVLPAEIVSYSVTARLTMSSGPDPELVRQLSEDVAAAYVELKRVMKGRVVSSGLHASLMQEGVEEVELVGWSDVVCEKHEAPFCTSLTVEIAGYV